MPRVSIYGTHKSFEINENDILYDSLSDRGEELPHGCLSGSCGACKVEIIEGKDHLTPPGVIESNTLDSIKEEFGEDYFQGKTIRLSCRAKVIGDIIFKPFK